MFGVTEKKNVRKQISIKLVTIDRRRSHLMSEHNYHTTKYFSEKLLAVEMDKAEIKFKRPLYFNLSILDINKIVIY